MCEGQSGWVAWGGVFAEQGEGIKCSRNCQLVGMTVCWQGLEQPPGCSSMHPGLAAERGSWKETPCCATTSKDWQIICSGAFNSGYKSNPGWEMLLSAGCPVTSMHIKPGSHSPALSPNGTMPQTCPIAEGNPSTECNGQCGSANPCY